MVFSLVKKFVGALSQKYRKIGRKFYEKLFGKTCEHIFIYHFPTLHILYITTRQYNFTPPNPIVKGKHWFEDRWRSCVREVDTSALSEPLGAMFIQDHFDQESRTLAEVGNELKSTFDYALNDKKISTTKSD